MDIHWCTSEEHGKGDGDLGQENETLIYPFDLPFKNSWQSLDYLFIYYFKSQY